jgi:hypothetical protein
MPPYLVRKRVEPDPVAPAGNTGNHA